MRYLSLKLMCDCDADQISRSSMNLEIVQNRFFRSNLKSISNLTCVMLNMLCMLIRDFRSSRFNRLKIARKLARSTDRPGIVCYSLRFSTARSENSESPVQSHKRTKVFCPVVFSISFSLILVIIPSTLIFENLYVLSSSLQRIRNSTITT